MGKLGFGFQPELNFIYINTYLRLMIRVSFYSSMILFLLLCSCTPKTANKADTANNDSIKKYLDLAGNDTLDAKLRDKYNDKAFSFVDLNRNDTLIRFYLSSLSFNYMRTKNLKKYKNISDIHFNKSTIAGFTFWYTKSVHF